MPLTAWGGPTPDQLGAPATTPGPRLAASFSSDPVAWASIILAICVLIGLYLAKVLRPGALGKTGLRQVNSHPWWVWLICALLIFMTSVVAGGVAASLPHSIIGIPESPRSSATIGLCAYAASLAAAFVLIRLNRSGSDGFNAPPKALGLGVLCFLLAAPVINAASIGAVFAYERFTHASIPSTVAHATLASINDHRHDPWAWLLAAIAIFAAPIQEEILYRGFLQTTLLSLSRRPLLSILVTSALFALVHRAMPEPVPWYAIATLFVLGLAMGLAFEKTKSIGVPIAMHILFNAANVALAILSS